MDRSSRAAAPEALVRELESCKMHFRSLIERNADGILVVSPEGFIRFANPSACTLLGCRCEDLIGQFFGIPVIPGETTEIDLPLTPAGVRMAEMRVVETEWEGQPACLATLRDTTERRCLEDALREQAAQLAEANRRKDEFLAMLSHELRNPLSPILNSARVLSLTHQREPEAQHHVQVIERQAKHLSRLVDELLDGLRVARGKVLLEREPVDLQTRVIQPALEVAEAAIREAGHHLSVTMPQKPLWVCGDATRLQQAMTNVLNNAAKYTPPGGRIWLEADWEGEEVVIRVRDTGIGIGAEDLPRVFELFQQAHRSLDRSQGGLGIGLAMVQALVEQHGGRVSARSAGLGCGSEFTVRLPALPLVDQGPTPAPAAPAEEILTGTGRRVLVVDDNRDAAESCAELMRLWGHEAYLAHDGPGALRLVEELRPDILLLDIGLPGSDGYSVAESLRQSGLREGLLLVALTGYGRNSDRARTAEAGFDHHLVKPVDLEELRAVIEGAAAAGCRLKVES